MDARPDPLSPYVPNLVVDWLADEPQRRHRWAHGTFVFADISGFTALTERLAVRGRAGAEEMGDLLNAVFERLLTAAYDLGAGLLKWGGDAVLLHFEGPEHLQRGAGAAWDMQAVMRSTGRLQTSAGAVRLGMSVGVHTGRADLLLVGRQHRELLIVGPVATETVLMEKVAERGQVVLSPAAAEGLPFACRGAAVEGGVLLARRPPATLAPNRKAKRRDVDLGVAMAPHLRDHLRGGEVEQEHRAVAIGFVEMGGCDALAARPDELVSEVERVLVAVQDAAEAHQVTLLATDVDADGAKVIVTSGAPHALGDAETRVLSTVRRVVDVETGLVLRGGVTCGSVFAGDYGPFYRRTYSVTGDVVNLAARLMARAAAGEVVALPEVVSRSRTAFRTSDLEPFHVKGKRAPIRAVSVHGVASAEEVQQVEEAFVGREEELGVLREGLASARDGQGRVVDLVAGPGLGKSRLVEELVRGAEVPILRADGDIYGSATPYQPLQRLLRRVLGLPHDAADRDVAAVLRGAAQAWAPDLLPYLPLLALVAGVDVDPTPEVDALDPLMRRDRLERVTSRLLGALLDEPVVLVLNDTHFMDEASVQLVSRLAADAAERSWLVVVTRRPAGPQLEAAPHVVSLPLRPLDDQALARLVTIELGGTALAPHRRAELVRRSAGNPLFLRQLLAAISSGADLDTLPDTVEAIIAVQVDRLPVGQRRWLRAASVLGATVDLTLLHEVLVDEQEPLDPAGIPGLLEATDERAVLRFAHDLVRLTAYEALPFRRRLQLHARVLDLLEQRGTADPALLALHSLRGQRFDAAWRYGCAAGDAATAAYSPSQAQSSYRGALEAASRLPDLPVREIGEVYARLARACMDLGEADAADRALGQARRHLKGDSVPHARVVVRTAWHRQGLGHHAQALRWVHRGRRLLDQPRSPAEWSLRAELAEIAAFTHYDRGNSVVARRWARSSVEESRRGQDRAVMARALGTLAVFDAMAGIPVGEDTVETALALYDEVGDVRGKGTAANKLAMCRYFAGRWDEAARLYALAGECFRRSGVEAHAAASAANLAEVLVQQGLCHEALGVLAPAFEVWRASESSSFLGFGLMLAGRAALELAEDEAAWRYLTEAHDLLTRIGETAEALTVEVLLADAALRCGDPHDALARAEQALAHAKSAPDTAAAVAQLHRVRGEALVAAGQAEDGAAALLTGLAEVRRCGAGDDLVVALDAVIRHGAVGPDELKLLRGEREELARALGVRRPAP